MGALVQRYTFTPKSANRYQADSIPHHYHIYSDLLIDLLIVP
jgi:hypothetical protein